MSTQVNVRLDEELLNEIDILTKVLHISRTEWLRTTIARAVKEDTLSLKEAIAMEYAKGNITDGELKEILGADSEDVKIIVRQIRKGKRTIDDMMDDGLL